MFLKKMKNSAAVVLGAGIVSLMMAGCGTGGASDVNPAPGPNPGDRVTITAANADKVLASSVGGVGKIATLINDLVDNLPGITSAGTSSYAIASSGESSAVPGKVALSLVSRDCAEGGSVEVGLSGDVTFKHCQERGILIDGKADVSISGSSDYDIEFTNVNVAFNTGTLYLGSAGASVHGGNVDFVIASGNATVQGINIEVKNLELARDASGTFVNGSIKTACMGGWVDVQTTDRLRFNGSDVLVGGKLLITGNGSSMLMEVNADGSVDVSLNGAPYANYPSASDLPQYNAVCP